MRIARCFNHCWKLYVVVFFLISQIMGAQSVGVHEEKNELWFVNLDFGVQMSGIKSEDFVMHNYSPLFRVNVGKWLSTKIGVQIGYQGNYFNTIADNDRHYYNFYYTQGIVSLLNVFRPESSEKLINLNIEVGFGYFQNNFYNNSSLHGTLGGSFLVGLNKTLKLKFNCSSIIGWDIYQGDQDIIPSLSFGLIKSVN